MTVEDVGGVLLLLEAEMSDLHVAHFDGKYVDLIEWKSDIYQCSHGFYARVSVAGCKTYQSEIVGSEEIAEHVGFQELAAMLAEVVEVEDAS